MGRLQTMRVLTRDVRAVFSPVQAVPAAPYDFTPTNYRPTSPDIKGKARATEEPEYDVETNYNVHNLPSDIVKYWGQRYRLFERFDEGIQMDKTGWFSVTPERIAQQIAERCRCNVIVDAFCGVGGNAIQFAFTCEKVIAIDNDPVRLRCARANARIYGVEDRIEFILGDYVEWAKQRAEALDAEPIDAVFLSPPWGGVDYLKGPGESPSIPAIEPDQETDGQKRKRGKKNKTPSHSFGLENLAPLHGKELFELSRQLTANIAYYLPRNMNLAEVAALAPAETIEVEEEWMQGKLKALTIYFGELQGNDAGVAEGMEE